MKIAILLSIVFSLFIGIGQVQSQQVEFILSPGVEKAREVFLKEKLKESTYRGWRIVVGITRERREIDAMQREFKQNFSDYSIEWVYSNPFYRLLSGTYLNRWDAMTDLEVIRREYPGAFEMNADIPFDKFFD